MTPQPTLNATTDHGKKIILRPAKARDVDAIFQSCRGGETLRRTTLPLDSPREEAEGFVSEYAPGRWARGEGATWVIADSDDDHYAGQLDLSMDCPQRGERHDGWISAILKGELA